ncbi:Hsp70 family protein [Mycobacterium aquaticum]|uniref:Hsp70 family protein n=1 Tax=Mycobacterium aquaticum TaxID=1927124 RepID=UPI001FEB3D45|nr:Hsp70 family protein [Mycobacterium aquaticum]
MRRSVLTLYRDRMPEVGVLDGDGLVISGFVERVGDPIPLLAADGSAHRGEQLLAAAVESLTRIASPAQRPERTVVAVPAYWGPAAFDAARAAMPGVRVVSDAVAALTAMQAHPGLPARGIVALADFGATGTSLTLADAGARFAPIGQTVRYDDFSGDLVDQELLRHVLSSLDADASGTAAVAALSRLREESRAAKERLSYEAATGLPGPAPGSTLRLTRAELEAVVDAPLRGVIEALHDLLRRNGVHPAQLAALVTVGGTARIPLVTQRLSEAFRMSVTTVSQAQVVTAIGAGLLARRGEAETAATRAVTAAPFVAASTTGTVAASSLAPAALAWSVSDPAAEVMDYIPESVSEDSARPAFVFAEAPREPAAAARTPWYRGIVVCAAALLTVVGTAGLLLSAHADKLDATPAGGPAAAPGLAPAEAPLAQVGAAPPTRTVVVQDPAVPAPAPAVSPSSAPYSVQRQQAASAPAPQAAPAPALPQAADPAPADIPAPAAVPPAPELPPIPQLPIPALPLPQLPVPQLPVPQLPIPTFTPPAPPAHTPAPTPEPTQTPTPEPTHTHTAPPPPPTQTQAPEPTAAPSSPPKPSHSTEPTTSAVPAP